VIVAIVSTTIFVEKPLIGYLVVMERF